jgi:steroid delta-isomerase-like uncharacterized protein
MPTRTPADTVSAYIEAYNAHDNEALLALCDDNVFVRHHNRELLAQGKTEYRAMLNKFIGLMPNKRWTNRRGFYVDGENVVVEHTWVGTSLEDAPGFARKNETVTVDICTCFKVRNGLVTEYHDYG